MPTAEQERPPQRGDCVWHTPRATKTRKRHFKPDDCPYFGQEHSSVKDSSDRKNHTVKVPTSPFPVARDVIKPPVPHTSSLSSQDRPHCPQIEPWNPAPGMHQRSQPASLLPPSAPQPWQGVHTGSLRVQSRTSQGASNFLKINSIHQLLRPNTQL